MIGSFQRAFTIVELTIIIVVMGTLLGVVAYSYSNWQIQAAQLAVKSDLRLVASVMSAVRNTENAYPNALPSNFVASPGVLVSYRLGNAASYCVDAVSTRYPSVSYHISQTNDLASGPC